MNAWKTLESAAREIELIHGVTWLNAQADAIAVAIREVREENKNLYKSCAAHSAENGRLRTERDGLLEAAKANGLAFTKLHQKIAQLKTALKRYGALSQ